MPITYRRLMESGRIPKAEIPGAFDLEMTLQSGQTFLWERIEDETDGPWFRTVSGAEIIDVSQQADGLKWRSSTDPVKTLRNRLDLDTALPQVIAAFPQEPIVQAAIERFHGLRVVNEPFVPTLISFILSAQMRITRIHDLVTKLRETYGHSLPWQDTTVPTFPSPEQLRAANERDLRNLGLGYRAPYVESTAEMLREQTVDVKEVKALPYEAARDALTEFVGVGPKVADCVLLFSLGFEDPVPLDTWIRTAIQEHFPTAEKDSYAATSQAIRDRLGPRPGYAQTYIFTHLRTRGA